MISFRSLAFTLLSAMFLAIGAGVLDLPDEQHLRLIALAIGVLIFTLVIVQQLGEKGAK